MGNEKLTGHVVNRSALPDKFPTQLHGPAFWEALGRAVATLTKGVSVNLISSTWLKSSNQFD
jgi:hypothetical protein